MTTGHGSDERLLRRYRRERQARQEAETIAERVTRELYAATEELHEANRAIREFVAVASHDLKGPLTAIIGSASLVHARWQTLSDDQRDQLLEAITRQGNHMSRLVDDLLTLSRIESGGMEPVPAAVELHDAIKSVVDTFTDRTADFRVDITEGAVADCDPDHLERILTNYVGNAVKYGDPPIEIEVHPANGWVEIRIRDYGDGVPDEFVPRLFGRFARADVDRTRERPGTGLGLSIVRGLAQVNGGGTWYEPNAPRGSCFGVRLPRRTA